MVMGSYRNSKKIRKYTENGKIITAALFPCLLNKIP
jgi:hypothetical protein